MTTALHRPFCCSPLSASPSWRNLPGRCPHTGCRRNPQVYWRALDLKLVLAFGAVRQLLSLKASRRILAELSLDQEDRQYIMEGPWP